jgi:hypothetical protein
VLWTGWGRDREAVPAQRVLGHLLSGLEGGGTVLHDSDCTGAPGSWQSIVAALRLLAVQLDRRALAVRPLRHHLTGRG